MTIAVTGVTGQLGRLAVDKLKTRASNADILGLARHPGKAADLGVAVNSFDYSRPAMLEPALRGVATLLLISGNEVGSRVVQHRNVIEAARRAGVKRIVYTSVLHADTSPLAVAGEHRETEACLRASGVQYTLLRNGWYTENYAGSIAAALAGGVLYGCAGNGRLSTAPRADFAEAAVAALVGSGHADRIYELAGDEPFTLTDLAAEISRQSGKNIPYHDVPEQEYATMLASFGLPEQVAKMVAGSDTAASRGALFDDSRQLSRLIGRPTTPLAVVVTATLRALQQGGKSA